MIFFLPSVHAHTAIASLQDTVITVSGVVRDQNGILPGATVRVVSDSTKLAVTNTNGEYIIEVAHNSTLEFYMVGYVSQQINVNKENVINVTLVESNNDLNEVVVIGYGAQKRITLSGSVSTVSSKQLKQSPVANLSNALAGRLPGLLSVQNSGEPGADAARIVIRGFGTYAGGAQNPLILVDGVAPPVPTKS
ncbi:carboxypeptidase-like regulatory domain-containing protein [Olivibacter sitiensis]|uniref:carboxypeptidase-like regulatory domain-containing protein n=1 Tax=Olivibacter sitiensis TaxID=376470 RepID=UPI00040A8634|nr:carboxypeptidase-like regulatory domain-containing protein [Olivibacter sitiensis]